MSDLPFGYLHPFKPGKHGPNCADCGWPRGHWIHKVEPTKEQACDSSLSATPTLSTPSETRPCTSLMATF
jgi:hypothetical protein